MGGPEKKSFGLPDKSVTTYDKKTISIVTLSDGTVLERVELEPGYRWSESVGRKTGAERCHLRHVGYVERGRIGVRMADGIKLEYGNLDVFSIPPDHDMWVVGEENAVLVGFTAPVTKKEK